MLFKYIIEGVQYKKVHAALLHFFSLFPVHLIQYYPCSRRQRRGEKEEMERGSFLKLLLQPASE